MSISGTLLLTLLTSRFIDFGGFSSKILCILAWIIFAISTLLGFVFLGIYVSKKTHYDTESRDKAIETIFNSYCKKR